MSLRGRIAGVTAVAEAQFLVVATGATPVAIPAEMVRGILQPEEAGQGQDIIVQDVTYPLADLTDRCGWGRSTAGAETRIVLCGDGANAQAFSVDQVMGLTDVWRSRILPLPPHFSGPERNWILGLFLFQDRVALVAHPEWLVPPRPPEAPAQAAPALLEPSPPTATAAPPASAPPPVAPRPVAPAEPVELVEAEEINLADQLEVEPLQEAGDAEDAPWADL